MGCGGTKLDSCKGEMVKELNVAATESEGRDVRKREKAIWINLLLFLVLLLLVSIRMGHALERIGAWR